MHKNEENVFNYGKRFCLLGCVAVIEESMELDELQFYFQDELVKRFCYLRNRLNASGGSETVVTAIARKLSG